MELPGMTQIGGLSQPDALDIAYDRYCDSLDNVVVEKQISSAIMGLEALYMDEADELPYRLSMRVGKLLSLTSKEYSPTIVRDNIKDAYNQVRNKYVHGEILKKSARDKLESKHGNLGEFARITKDYLRASIVALLNRPNKKNMIRTLDSCFLESSKDEEVREFLFNPYLDGGN
jgi:hypothetical protein